jgi:hypothetical protein
MQRITNPFSPFMNTQQPFQKLFFNRNTWVRKFQQPLFRGLIKEFIKTRYPLKVRDTLHLHIPTI